MQSSSAQVVCLDMPPYTHMLEEKEQDPLAQSYARRVAAAQQQPDFVLWSLFNFVFLNFFCCLGLAALVFSIKSRDRKVAGDPDGAASYGKTAKCLNIITAVIVSILVIITIGVVIYFAVAFRSVALRSDGFTKPWQ